MNKNILCSESMKGTLPDVWTWPIQTNTRHQHSIKKSFYTPKFPQTEAKGRRHLVIYGEVYRFCDHERGHLLNVMHSENSYTALSLQCTTC